MYVVTVLFKIHPANYGAFMQAMVGNARTSLQDEPGCHQFDVCEGPAGEHVVYLYELYDDEAAFRAHLATPHFLQFNELTLPWVAAKSVATYQRAWPAP